MSWRAVEDQRGDMDRRRHVAHVDVEEHPHQRLQHPGAGAGALDPTEERGAPWIVRDARGGELDGCALAPVRPHELDARGDQVLCG